MSTGVRGRGCRNWAIATLVALVVAAGATAVLLRSHSAPSEVWLVPPVPTASQGHSFSNLRPSPHDDALEGYSARTNVTRADGTIAEIELREPDSGWDGLVRWLTRRDAYRLGRPRRYVATDETCNLKGVEWRKFALRGEGAR